MNLPDLPRKNRRQEDVFGGVFKDWFSEHSTEFTDASFELKDTDGKDYLAFDEVKEAQVDSGLRNESNKGNLIRALVASPGTADYLFFRNIKTAYIVIRYPKCFALIRIKDFLKEKQESKRRSLTSARAKELSTVVVAI